MENESTKPQPVPAEAGGEPVAGLTRRGLGRRSLLRAGASAAPVLLTLRSGPVSATGTIPCTVASSFVSAATFASRSPGSTYLTCTTKHAGNWHDDSCAGCSGTHPTTAPFNSSNVQWPAWAAQLVSTHLCSTSSTYDSWWVGTIMKGCTAAGAPLATSGELAVLQLIMGLTLTIQYASGYIQTAGAPGGELTKAYLVDLWRQYKASGKFVNAASGINWGETEILTWLKMLQYYTPV